jgi:hypothetical protein
MTKTAKPAAPKLIPQRGGSAPLPWTVTKEARNIHTVELLGTSRTNEWWFLLSSDRHHDNPHARHDQELKHLEEAVAKRAGILDLGDQGCLMEGRHDPRRARKGVREEHMDAPDYLDSVIRHASEFYAPYARNFVVIGRGNHEDSVLKNCDTDYTERVCERMSMLSGHKVYPGGYGGWVRFWTRINGERYGLALKYFHGAGGAPLMSHGTLSVRRHAAIMPDADVVCTGHIHKRWIVPINRERLVCDRGGTRIVQDYQWHCCTGSYKDAYGDGYGGWEVMKGMPPGESGGGIWMRLYLEKRSAEGRTRYGLVPQFIMAD